MSASFASIPAHIAIIMDGNGRWAEQRRWGRPRGHQEGARRVDEIVTHCTELGVRYLTLYAFSTENWNRPAYEVNMLWRLLVQHLRTMDKKLLKNKVSLAVQGSIYRLPPLVKKELDRVMTLTARPDPNMILNLSLSYGGRQEIVDAARAIAEKILKGECAPDAIDERLFAKHLYHPEIPDPDLLIRTGGESRVSNFLLWEIAYSEFYVTEVLWPEFGPEDLEEAIHSFGRRQRRFGKTGKQVTKGHKPEANA